MIVEDKNDGIDGDAGGNEIEVELQVQVDPLDKPRAEVIFVDSDEALQACCEVLSKGEGHFGVDAERASGFKYSQRAYLIQIHRRNQPIFLIDPWAISPEIDKAKFAELAKVLSTEGWILHAASQDIPCLSELGLVAPELFDTELGSRIAGIPRVGLGAVTEHFLQLKLAKEHSAVDWSTRPLQANWLNYAALDVDVLHDLWDALRDLLIEQKKLDWAEQEFRNTLAMPTKEAKPEKWRGMTGLHEVREQRGLAVAHSLWLAREELAQKLDVSPGRLVPDSSIVGQAKNPSPSKPQLASNRSFVGRASRSYLDTWWRAISEGSTTKILPPLKAPATGIPNHRTWPNRFPEAHARLNSSKPVIVALGEAHGIPQENILTPDFLRRLCFEPPAEISPESVAELLRTFGARQWQIELVSSDLAAALTTEQ